MYKIAAIITFAIALASCNNNKAGGEKMDGYQTSLNGLQYKIIRDESSPNAKVGEFVKFSSTLRTLGGEVVFSTNDSNQPVYGQVAQPRHKGDPLEILQLLGAGDSASVIIPESEFFKDGTPLPATVKKGDKLRMDIWIMEVLTAQKYQNEVLPAMQNARYAGETKAMDDYIAAKGWSAVTLPSGLKVVIDSKGNGTPATDGSKIKVNYTGRLLDGTVFDSNELAEFNHVSPFELTLGKRMVIAGWEEGLKNFGKGGKGKLIIPARLGYGDRGSGKIPPNAPLVFEVEILEITPGA